MSEQQPQAAQPKPFNVHGETDQLMGRYANAFSVTSQERDVAIDFFSHVNTAGQPAQLVSRLFLNRFTAQELVNVLQQTIQQWEKMRYEAPKDGAK